MASRRLPTILALEIESAGWQANGSVGDTQTYPRDEHCQSSVGSAADPWRTPQARHRYRTDQRAQVRGQGTRPAIPRLEDVPSQSCRRHWIANQITEACGWEQASRYLIRDRDGASGEVFIRRLRSM